jgi:hypothetical protein
VSRLTLPRPPAVQFVQSGAQRPSRARTLVLTDDVVGLGCGVDYGRAGRAECPARGHQLVVTKLDRCALCPTACSVTGSTPNLTDLGKVRDLGTAEALIVDAQPVPGQQRPQQQPQSPGFARPDVLPAS